VELATQTQVKPCPDPLKSAASPISSQPISSTRCMEKFEPDEKFDQELSQSHISTSPPDTPPLDTPSLDTPLLDTPQRVHLSQPLQKFVHHQDLAKRCIDLQSEVQDQKSLQESNAKEIAILKVGYNAVVGVLLCEL